MIREARMKAGLSRTELGERMGISESAVTKLENIKSNPSVNTLKRIAKAIGAELVIDLKL